MARSAAPRSFSRRSGPSSRLPGWALPVGLAALLLVGWLVLRPKHDTAPDSKWAPVVAAQVVRTLPHDPSAFTQGFLVDEGDFVEGTGMRDSSVLRRVEMETGAVRGQVKLDSMYFGEGVALAGDRLFQITWQEGKAFVWDRTTLAPLDTFSYEGEGWGLTFDGTHLVMSDGSARLTYRDPATFAAVRTVQAKDNGQPVEGLNELEFVNGRVLANVWGSDRVAVIDPATGLVTRWIAMEGLRALLPRTPGMDVLNGLAYDAATGKLYATGKRWSLVFELDPAVLTEAVPAR